MTNTAQAGGTTVLGYWRAIRTTSRWNDTLSTTLGVSPALTQYGVTSRSLQGVVGAQVPPISSGFGRPGLIFSVFDRLMVPCLLPKWFGRDWGGTNRRHDSTFLFVAEYAASAGDTCKATSRSTS